MEREKVLIRAGFVNFLQLAAAFSVASSARAEDALRTPEKLTVALSDELLGQLAPDGRSLHFVSNRNATSQIFVQDLHAPVSKLLFDEGADVTWPRVSRDGKRLLYVSFRDEATGQLCVRDLPSLTRRCLAGGGALEAAWAGDEELVLLERSSLHGDLRLVRVSVAGERLRSTPLTARNLNGPAVSPPVAHGRWLAFVPLERVAGRIGPAFAAQASPELIVRQLDGDREFRVRFDLPGATGQPAFSIDGKWLYFTQFLDDTDENGTIDGDDHGVIFRVPFDPSSDVSAALSRTPPEQLTTAAWNCQYPAPSTNRLIVTCARAGSLDVYALPLDGVAATGWTAERLRDEVRSSRDRWERLLLLSRLLRVVGDPTERATLLAEVVWLHLGLHEYEAALHHARALAHADAPALASLGPLLEPLIAERRALRAFDRGQLGHRFLDEARLRLETVLRAPAGELPDATALRHLIASELYDDIGDKAAALDELGLGIVHGRSSELVVEMRAERLEALLRELDRREDLVAGLRALVDHPSLSEEKQLEIGGVYARAIALGLPVAAADAARASERAIAGTASTQAFSLDLGTCLDRVTKATLGAGRACQTRLYEEHSSPARRRTLALEVLRRAEVTDADDLEYELVRRYVSDLPADSSEHRHATRLLRLVVEDYAYAALAAGHLDAAAAEFEGVTRVADSLESVAGFIEAALAAGRVDVERSLAARFPPDSPVMRFVRAYLAVRSLGSLHGAAFDRASIAALAFVQEAEQALPQKTEVQALHGTLLHLRFLHANDRAAAEEANTHYLLALDLAEGNPRYRAMVLEQLALLHAQVGNFRIAVGHFEERAKLPFADPLVALGHHLGRALSLFHLERDAEAAQAAEAGLALLDRTPSLARFLPLAADRAALYSLSAGDAARALALYDRTGAIANQGSDRNRLVRSLARAAAALADQKPTRALADLDDLDRALGDPAAPRSLGKQSAEAEVSSVNFDLLRLGLRGQAQRSLGRHDDARRTLGTRHDLLIARAAGRNLDDDLLSLALAEAQLADLALARKAPSEAAQLASQALEHADRYASRTGTPLADAQLSALGFAAELHLSGGVPAAAFQFDLGARLRDAFNRLCDAADTSRHEVRLRFGGYLTLLGLDRSR